MIIVDVLLWSIYCR